MIDHLVYAVPDLEGGIAAAARLLGVAPTAGGRHVGRGTRNALVGLGGATYLEIIGPDPTQAPPHGPRPFGIDELASGRLVAWAVRCEGIDDVVASAARAGFQLGPVESMSRATPSGGVLSWRLTPPRAGTTPFLIDWGRTPHPAETLDPSPLRLVELRIAAPDHERLVRLLEHLDVVATVEPAGRQRMEAILDAGSGPISLA